ncbi:7-cyano-7-deazaguanine synthase QueC [Candidimonas sp. SYP-B2681]|uniref:7-cyano-7-deazaguanine synthase QueC n=1 Tax=Candidimonas sp. SYP-B2681 TaxID=2497686 RepID=UPI000F87FF06|nr:7-cyano-7-deazaguanine synthase QueC [Candidimonas sp. SYP-B2681]RTZ40018.1 7-cyano-7-deazaguanine synthase QueC [Candidimonas sp. SYP-B2681]
MSRALVLFSGGQDSTACLAWALDRYSKVETVGFNYGQRHVVEMECRQNVLGEFKSQFPDWVERLGDDHVLDLSLLGQLSDCALTAEKEIAFADNGLPNTFVPGRNLIFLTYAAALAYRRGIDALVAGMCETDYSGYPDCRDNTMQALQLALNLGMEQHFRIETPLMWLDKAATWRLAEDIGGNKLIALTQEYTHSCYLGDRSVRHDWGYGCGTCPACELRARGYKQFVAQGGSSHD